MPVLPLTDPKWKTLHGGYGDVYDASVPLAQLEEGEDVWDELWEELHHQGDVGEASYAAVPHIVRITAAWPARGWQPYALLSTIEGQRYSKRNPPLPDWLTADYFHSWEQLLELAMRDVRTATDPLLLRSLLGTLAFARGAVPLGCLISAVSQDEIKELLEERYGWPDRYEEPSKR
jgi:hypothetical protein